MKFHKSFTRGSLPAYPGCALARLLLALLLSLRLLAGTCWAWGGDGHQITAYIAADHLTETARRHVAQILGVPDNPRAVAQAMARAALRPDAVFRNSEPETIDWHFLNLCRQDTPADEPARCPNHACLTAQMHRFVDDLRAGKPDGKWDSAAQLAFVINFMGELHQPLHSITNADMGGKCVGVIAPVKAGALHSVWGEGMVDYLERRLRTSTPAETAAALQQRYPDVKVKIISIDSIAWESHHMAEMQAYEALNIPVQPCQPTACVKPKQPVKVSKAYIDSMWKVVGHQLAIGGYRLAALLNGIWKD